MALAAFLSPIQRQIQAGKFIACSRIGPPNHCYWNASVSTHWPTSIHNSASLTSNSRICKSHKHNKRAKRSSYFQLGGRRKRSSITGIPIVLNSTKMIRNIYPLTKDVSKIHTGSEGGFRGWGQSDTSWVYQWYKVSKNVFGKAVLSLVAEFQK